MEVPEGFPELSALVSCVKDLAQPIGKRTHAAFFLRTLATADAIEALSEALKNKEDSALLRHELAYILGQIQDSSACKVLSDILRDPTDDVMVRHECAEALGAIGNPASLEVLREFSTDPLKEISETCQLAIDLIDWRQNQSSAETDISKSNHYHSVDPAPGDKAGLSVEELQQQLMDTSLPLFKRYRAMFSLRNIGTPEAVEALATGFQDESALFRHEIAYVFGQLQHIASVPALTRVLQNEAEHRMVRHEAAEALGSIGGEQVVAALQQYKEDSEKVVAESCEVALDTADYWAGIGAQSVA